MRTCKTVPRKTCIHIEDKRNISQFTCTVIVVAKTMKSLAVVTPPSIYHGCSTRKIFWKEKFTPVHMRSCGHCNMRKHKEIKNDEQYISLDIHLELG